MISSRVPAILCAALCLAVALASLRWIVLPLDLVMEHMAHYSGAALWGHVLFGPLALALVPVQLSARLRARAPGLHRAAGYLSLLSILIAALSALLLLPNFLGTPFAASGFAALAVLWIVFPALGVAAARRGDLAAHRRWMLRTCVLTFGAVTLRIIMAPLMAAGWSVVETYQVTAWGNWLPFLIALELWLRRRTGAPA